MPIINWPTRVDMNTCNLVDNIFINNYDVKDQQLQGILKTDISDNFIRSAKTPHGQWI